MTVVATSGVSGDVTGNATSAVPVGMVGTSSVAGAEPGVWLGPVVVCTTAGTTMSPMVGGVVVPGERSALPREKPHTTSPAAARTATVEPMRTRRDRRLDAIALFSGAATRPTLPMASRR